MGEARLSNNPIMIVPGALQAVLALGEAVKTAGIARKTRTMVHLRASQINGCSYCADMHARELRQAGETDQRLATVAAWRDAPWFTGPERAALALAEAATRLSDRADPVPDAVWAEAARHYDEPALAALVLEIGLINLWNRVNVSSRQVAGARPGG
ncbi:MAG TPA: carboxymuconolactone decarboxylase family protein [Longimicrobium sp.]|nr:carboxymuconolactone decarboxylase family protein [Longimicrobium sp.]